MERSLLAEIEGKRKSMRVLHHPGVITICNKILPKHLWLDYGAHLYSIEQTSYVDFTHDLKWFESIGELHYTETHMSIYFYSSSKIKLIEFLKQYRSKEELMIFQEQLKLISEINL